MATLHVRNVPDDTYEALRRRRVFASREAVIAVGRLGPLPLTSGGSGASILRAWELRQAITPFDACYVALAETLRAPLVTADRKLIRALAHREVRTVFLGDLA